MAALLSVIVRRCSLEYKIGLKLFVDYLILHNYNSVFATTTELVNAVFMVTKLAGDINVYDYRVREFEKIYR